MSDSTIEKTILGADPKHTNHLLKSLLDQSLCPVCQDYMFVPFMTQCGHNFCYECLNMWLSHNLSCPACRAPVENPPYFNVFAQGMIENMMEAAGKLMQLSDSSSHLEEGQEEKSVTGGNRTDQIYARLPEHIRRDRDLKMKQYRKDLVSDNLFKRIFQNLNSRTAVLDSSDGVARCSNCHWEVTGNVCPNCHLEIRNPYSHGSGDEEEYGYPGGANYLATDEELDSEIDGYFIRHADEVNGDDEDDDDDSFIDARDSEEIEAEQYVEDDLLSSSHSSPARRPRVYFPSNLDDDAWEDQSNNSDEENASLGTSTDYEIWNGFQEEVDRVLSENDGIEENGGSSDPVGETLNILDDDSEESDSFTSSVVARRGRRNNYTITISDDDCDEEEG